MSEIHWAWSAVLTAIGLVGFYLAGKRVWWAWYVNIANQAIWAAYAVISTQWAFLIGTAFYLWVFVKNAYAWTKEHREEQVEPESDPFPLPVDFEVIGVAWWGDGSLEVTGSGKVDLGHRFWLSEHLLRQYDWFIEENRIAPVEVIVVNSNCNPTQRPCWTWVARDVESETRRTTLANNP